MLRNMTAIYITHEDKILLLYRVGSRVVRPSWCGIGGHFENCELNDPQACVLRELYEESGIKQSNLANLRLKYISLRMKSGEIRQNYYFFADLIHPEIALLPCDEGQLEWADIASLFERDMPYSAKCTLEHYFKVGIRDNHVYSGVTTQQGVAWTAFEEF